MNIIKLLLKQFGLDISRTRRDYSLYGFLRQRKIDLVVDVGANIGQYANQLRTIGYEKNIISFEPNPIAFSQLLSVSKNDNLWTISQVALGSSAQTRKLNITEDSTYSSLKKPLNSLLGYDPRAQTLRQHEVYVTTLDKYLINVTSENIFLKIDVQGFEREVLMGCTNSLSRISGIQLELSCNLLYEGGWLIREALDWLDDHDYTPAQFSVTNTIRTDPSSALEFDCVFRKRAE